MFRRTATPASVRSFSQVPCTAWRRTCTRSSFPPPEPAPADRASAEGAVSQAEASPEADSAAAAGARSSLANLRKLRLILKTLTLVILSADKSFAKRMACRSRRTPCLPARPAALQGVSSTTLGVTPTTRAVDDGLPPSSQPLLPACTLPPTYRI